MVSIINWPRKYRFQTLKSTLSSCTHLYLKIIGFFELEPPSKPYSMGKHTPWLVTSRFILNLPDSEYDLDRFFFNMQKAFWYYKDFLLEDESRRLSMKQFARVICDKIPHEYDLDSFEKYHSTFLSYIHQIPVYGAIILNSDLTKVLLGNSTIWEFVENLTSNSNQLL